MIQKMCLGTVQFGMKYGINNKYGQPTKQDVFEMIDISIERGIRILDTASAYGEAEELIGEYLSKRKNENNIQVISKLRPNLIELETLSVENVILKEIETSIKKMNIEKLDGYLLHTPQNFYDKRIIESLIKAKEKNLISNMGVSVYEYEDAINVVNSDYIDYIQIPYSIFDQRIDTEEFFESAKKNNVKIFARSAFLQGLITMDPRQIPKNLEEVKHYLDIYDLIIQDYGISRIQGAILYVYDNPNVDYLVFGVDNKNQLVENLDIVENIKVREEFRDRIKKELSNIGRSIIFPSLWSKKER